MATEAIPSVHVRPALYALAAGSFAIGATEFLPAAMLPTIARDLRVTLAQAGLLVSGYALGVTLATPILATLLSKAPRRRVLIGLMLMIFAANGAAALANGFGLLLAIRFFTAFGHGTYFAAATTAAARLAPPGRSAGAISVVFSGLTIAMATVVPLASYAADALGWRIAFGGAALLGVVAAGAIAAFVPDIAPPERPGTWGDLARALREPRLLLALAITLVGFSGTFVLFTFLKPYLREAVGLSSGTTALLLGSLGITVSIGNLLGGRFVEGRLHKGLAILFGLLGLSLLLIGLVTASKALSIVAVMLFGLIMLSTGAGLQDLAIRQAARWGQGVEDAASGLSQSSFNVGIVLGSLVGARVVDSSVGLAGLPWVGGLVAFLAVGVTLLGARVERRDQPGSVPLKP